MPEISIIVPVYNCDLFLEKCIRSIQKQNVDLEIICVDDGSTDGSKELLQKLSEKDNRIRWYTQNHTGAAAARNLGINMSVGNYISFVDADDFYLDENAIKRMIQKCRDYNVSACGSVMSLFQKQTIKEAENFKLVEKMAQQGTLNYKDYQMDYDFTTFIFKRAVIVDNNITFPHYGYYEDPPFLSKVLYAVKEFVMCDVKLYCYRIRSGYTLNQKQCEAVLDGIKENMLFAMHNNLEKLFHRTLLRLEYEYGDKILNHLKVCDVKFLEKLIEINNIVRSCYGNHTIRPINKLLAWNQFAIKNYKQYLLSLTSDYSTIYIYGAGVTSRKFEKYLECMGIENKIQGFIITDADRDKEMVVSGLRVYGFYDVLQYLDESLIFIAVGSVYVAEIVQMLEEKHVRSYEIVDAVFLDSI